MNRDVNFEQLISFHPTSNRLGDQPTLKDMVFDYYCGALKDTDRANEATKKYLDEIHQVYCNQLDKGK